MVGVWARAGGCADRPSSCVRVRGEVACRSHVNVPRGCISRGDLCGSLDHDLIILRKKASGELGEYAQPEDGIEDEEQRQHRVPAPTTRTQ